MSGSPFYECVFALCFLSIPSIPVRDVTNKLPVRYLKGLHDRLLLKPKLPSMLHTEKVPRSSVLDRLQSFLPQMALANKALQQQMETAPTGHFDIESVVDAEKVIEMDVALVELDGSDSSEEEESSEDSSSDEETVTEEKLKLPGSRKRKANIQVLEREGDREISSSTPMY